MNMKNQIFMTAALLGMGLMTILPWCENEILIAEAATTMAQETAFVEVLPEEPETKDETQTVTADSSAAGKYQKPYREGLAAYITSVNPTVTKEEALSMADAILAQSEVYGVDEKLILAIAHTESTYYSDAVSCADCKGLMQTGDHLAEEAGYEPDALFDPKVSIAVGTSYISEQIDNFDGDLSLALTAYNQGPSTVYEGNYDTTYAETTMERVESIETFLFSEGYK